MIKFKEQKELKVMTPDDYKYLCGAAERMLESLGRSNLTLRQVYAIEHFKGVLAIMNPEINSNVPSLGTPE
jgi:hypothetical protein